MQSLKLVKKALKKDKVWRKYKKIFRNKQMRFSISFIIQLFYSDVSVEELTELEKELANKHIDSKMFTSSFKILINKTYNKINWNSLSEFLWFQYQTSTYWKDVKRNRKNVFNNKNYIQLNAKKRDCWQAWIDSLDSTNSNFNRIIISVLGKVT